VEGGLVIGYWYIGCVGFMGEMGLIGKIDKNSVDGFV